MACCSVAARAGRSGGNGRSEFDKECLAVGWELDIKTSSVMSYDNCRYPYAGSRAGKVLAGCRGGAPLPQDGFDN